MQFSLTRSIWFTIRSALILLLVFMLSLTAWAQPTYDGATPAGMSRGNPAGSYPLSGFDNVNLFNGHMNFHLPLISIGGRGNAAHTIMLPIEQVWTSQIADFNGPTYAPNYNWWDGIKPGYGAGVMQARHTSEGCEEVFVTYGTTRLTFTLADGTEYEFIDPPFGGEPTASQCTISPFDPQNGTSRGTTWVTRDGSSATFISDQPIKDIMVSTFGPWVTFPSGYLRLANGTTYRIDLGYVQWLRDRNGNRINFTYTNGKVSLVTDSLNRQVAIEYDVQDATHGLCDRITYKGFAGASRVLRVLHRDLTNALDAGQTLKTYSGTNGLFPGMAGSSTTLHNPRVTSGVVLPDGRSYQFRYSSYSELTKVTLPTGGVFTYVWGPGVEGAGPSGGGPATQIYRRVLEKRTYTDNGTTLAGLTTFGRYDNIYGPEGSASIKQHSIDGYATVISQSKHYFHSGPLAHAFDTTMWLPDQLTGKEKKTEQLDQTGAIVLTRMTSTWTYGGTLAGTPINPHVSEKVVTIEPAAANLVSKQTLSYDSYNNLTDVNEYGFNNGSPGTLVRRTHSEYLTTNPVNGQNYATNTNIHLRLLPKKQQVFEGTVLRSSTTFEYDNYATDTNHASIVNRANISGLDAAYTNTYGTRGNGTAITSALLNTSGQETGSTSTYAQYDIAGNVVKTIDARGNATTSDFSDRYGIPDGDAQANSGSTELGTQISYAFVTKVTNALGHIGYQQFDYYLGKPVNSEDANGIVSGFQYGDALDRLNEINRAVGTGVYNRTNFSYDDANRTITTSNDLNALNDGLIVAKILYDGLGRPIEGRQYEGGGNYIATQAEYDALGRPYKTSNPFRPCVPACVHWTIQSFDALGRVTSVKTPDNALVTTVYSGNSVTVTDQAGKSRKSVTDALGRLIEVYEDPNGLNYLTSYMYDVLDNLVKVTQGSQQRFFMYDSLKRLIRVRNPEQGTLASLNLSDPLTGNSAWSTGYQYDANGNQTQKTDPRGVISIYAYDALNRITTVDYSDTSSINPDVKRFYDGATNGKGLFWHHYTNGDSSTGSNVEHTSIDSYDSLGRPLVQRQLFKLNGTWSPTYQVSRSYNRAGGVTLQTYPSNRSVSYNYDVAGRLADKDAEHLAFTGNLGDNVQRTYASGNTYTQWGSLSMERFGTQTALYHKLQYNIRGQLWDVRVATGSDVNGSWDRGALQFFYESTLTHGASGPDNNGNVLKSSHYVPNDQGQALAIPHQLYAYDSLNRLTSVAEYFVSDSQPIATQTSLQSYSYNDRWGNRTINATQTWGTGINNKQFTVDANTNRLGVPGGQSGLMSYDSAGNLTNDTYTGAGTRTYDAENRMTTAADNISQTSRYTYNADGQRTRRQVGGGQEEWQIYGFDGELLAEYQAAAPASSPKKEYGYRNGQLLVTATPAISSSHSLSVNGTNAYVQVPNSTSLNISGAITVEAWIKPNSIGAYQHIASRETYGVSGTGGGYELTLNNVGKARFDLYHSHNSYTPVIGSTTLTTGQWHHVAGVWDGAYLRIYVNGVLDGTVTTGNGPASGTSSLKLGRNSGGNYFNGLIDEVRVSNMAVYSSNFTPQTHLSASANTKGLWKFDGQVATDASTNGNNGTLQGGATYSNDVPSGDGGGGGGGSTPSQTLWLVPDHLGTPRIIVDQTGLLANVKRHDYLPFGEELFAGTGGRTAAMGYTGDGVRQQFTAYERDNETGLDYAHARYYANVQGRFTSPDPYVIFFEMNWGRNARERAKILKSYASEPRNWNRYSYCVNDPANLIDPSGLIWLTNDNENYQWVDDDKYKKEDWKGYRKVEAGTIAYFGEGWGGYADKYKHLIGSYVTLNEDGSLGDTGVSEVEEDRTEEIIAGANTMIQWTTFRTQLPDFSPAYVQLEVDFPGPPIKVGPAIGLTLDRNGNIYTGVGAYAGTPGFNVSLGWLLPNEPPENIEAFLVGHSGGGSAISSYWIGGGVTRASGRTSPQVMAGSPGVSASYLYSKKRRNVGPIW